MVIGARRRRAVNAGARPVTAARATSWLAITKASNG